MKGSDLIKQAKRDARRLASTRGFEPTPDYAFVQSISALLKRKVVVDVDEIRKETEQLENEYCHDCAGLLDCQYCLDCHIGGIIKKNNELLGSAEKEGSP